MLPHVYWISISNLEEEGIQLSQMPLMLLLELVSSIYHPPPPLPFLDQLPVHRSLYLPLQLFINEMLRLGEEGTLLFLNLLCNLWEQRLCHQLWQVRRLQSHL